MSAAGDKQAGAIRPEFDRSISIDFRGAKITSDEGFLIMREIDQRFNILSAAASQLITGLGRNRTMSDLSVDLESGEKFTISEASAQARSEQILFSGVEVGTTLSVEIPGVQTRFSSRLVGLEPDQFLIIRVPAIPGIRQSLAPGMDIVIRFVSNGAIVGFKSSIIQIHFEPLGVGFLAFPFYAERVSLRKQKRVQCFFETRATIKESEFEGAILDINTKGCRFSVDDSRCGSKQLTTIEKGDTTVLSVAQLGSDPIGGKIANIRYDSGLYSFGIEFTKISPELLEKIDGMQSIASRIQS